MTNSTTYDYLNRLTSVSSLSSLGSLLSLAYAYNNANQRTRSTLADNSYWSYTYDSLGQVTTGHKYWADQTPVAGQQFDYAFDSIGNRTSTKAGGDQNGGNQRTANYGANSLNQYTNRDVPAAFDVMGLGFATNAVTVNSQTPYRKGEYFRAEVPVSNGSTSVWQSVSVVASNQTTVSGNIYVPKNQERFYYDGDGNLTNDGRWAYTWDAENRLVSMTNNTSIGPKQGLKFEYDWNGRRIHKQVWSQGSAPTNDVKFIYGGWNLLAELNATNNAVIRSFMWGLDLSGSPQGAGGVGGLLEVIYKGAQTTNCFVAFDGSGNVTALADAGSTNILAQYEYGPFGEVIRATGPMAKANPLRFSSKYQDDETDLLYYDYRYYNASTAKWLSRDSAGEPGGLNLYAFNRNAPISFIDADGAASQMVGFTYNPDTGAVTPQYVDQQFGQDYGMGLHNPFNPPSQMIMNQRALWEKTSCCQNTAWLFTVYTVSDLAAGLAATAENPPKAIIAQVQDLAHLGSGVGQGTLNGVLGDVRRVSSAILIIAPIKAACCSRAGTTVDQAALTEARAAAQRAADTGLTGAGNAANGVRLNQQLSAQSAFNASGGLSQEALNGSSMIFKPGELGNPAIPSGFGKYTTQTFNSPCGPFQVHFYMNPITGDIWTDLDYKAVFNNPL